MNATTDTAAKAAQIPATPEAQAELMFELARNIAADPGCEIRPEGIALIACAAGIIGQAVARLEQAQARADQAYAEGLRQRGEASATARAQAEPESTIGFTELTLDGRRWRIDENQDLGEIFEDGDYDFDGRTLTLELHNPGEVRCITALLHTAKQFGRRIRISIEEPT